MRPVLTWVLALATGSLLLISPAFSADKTHEGVVVKVVGDTLTMANKDGSNEHSHKVSPSVKTTCDGKDCRLGDLKAGYIVRVTVTDDAAKTVTAVEALTKKK